METGVKIKIQCLQDMEEGEGESFLFFVLKYIEIFERNKGKAKRDRGEEGEE